MTHQLCIAPHRDNPPYALGGLLLCAGHLGALEDALTGLSAADDPTVDVQWGVHVGWGVVNCDDRAGAYASGCARVGGNVVCNDGTGWTDPRHCKPGGLARDWTALAGLTGHKTASASYVTGTAEAALPINPAVADLRDRIPGVLASWARVHLEELPYTATRPASGTPAVLCAWLAITREWAATQPWAGEYVAELSQLRGRARRLIDLPTRPRAHVGPCVERGPDGQRCAGTLTSAIREEDDPRGSLIECDVCPAAWDSTQWMRLGQRIAMQARRMAA